MGGLDERDEGPGMRDEEGRRGTGPDERAPPPPGDGPPGGPAEPRDETPGDDGPVGVFPSWGWLYGAVLVWFVVVVVALYVLTVTLDLGAP